MLLMTSWLTGLSGKRADKFFTSMRNHVKIVLLLAAVAGLSSCEDILTDLGADITREMLEDTWKVEETGGSYKSAEEVYYVEISLHPTDSGRILIYNFYNVDADAEAVLDGGMDLLLPRQTIEGGYTVSGSGQVQGNKANQIIWTYSVNDGSGVAESITAVYSRLTF